ncbi:MULTISPECIES: hypothetical protein [unclassified Agrococcus]|uniref:hypothetical protein n=1 Tax=unclassified Agrococcus TaxID=2615065 RepID=UPI0036096B00
MHEELGASTGRATVAASNVARALLVAALVVLVGVESYGIVISAVKAELYDDIGWPAYLASEWPQRLIMTPVILAAAAAASRSRALAAAVAVVVLAWAVACALIPADLPHQSYPWGRLDSWGWHLEDHPGVTVLPGEVAPTRALGVALCGAAAGMRAGLPTMGRMGGWASGATVALVAAGALVVSGSVLFQGWYPVLQDALHALGVVVGVALLVAGRGSGVAIIAIVGVLISLLLAWDAAWVLSAGAWNIFPLVGGSAVLWLVVVLIALAAVRVDARRQAPGAMASPTVGSR